MLGRFLFKKELYEILENNNYSIKSFKKLSRQDKNELFEKFTEIALVSSACGVLVNEKNFEGYLKHSKFNELLM